MSIKATCKTEIDNETDLVEALESIYGKIISVVPEGVDVRGYSATQRPTVLVNIKGLYGTAGFSKNTTGKYELVYDSMDRRKLQDLIPQKVNGVTTDRLAQAYSKVKVNKAIKGLRGGKLAAEHEEEDGTVRIKIRVNAY